MMGDRGRAMETWVKELLASVIARLIPAWQGATLCRSNARGRTMQAAGTIAEIRAFPEGWRA
jgi:hypothetical protein